MTALIVLIIIGFPVTLILAWGFEITMQGVVRHEDTDGGAPRLALAKYLSLIAAVVVAGGSLFYYLQQEH